MAQENVANKGALGKSRLEAGLQAVFGQGTQNSISWPDVMNLASLIPMGVASIQDMLQAISLPRRLASASTSEALIALTVVDSLIRNCACAQTEVRLPCSCWGRFNVPVPLIQYNK